MYPIWKSCDSINPLAPDQIVFSYLMVANAHPTRSHCARVVVLCTCGLHQVLSTLCSFMFDVRDLASDFACGMEATKYIV